MRDNCPSDEGAQAIRANIVRTVTLILDNDQWPYDEITARVEELSSFDICQPGGDGHEDCSIDEGLCCGMGDWPDFDEVGNVIMEWLDEYIAEHVGSVLGAMMLRDLLDMGDRALIEMFGEHYYPDDALQALRAAGKA